jgi:hypothetical protein
VRTQINKNARRLLKMERKDVHYIYNICHKIKINAEIKINPQIRKKVM